MRPTALIDPKWKIPPIAKVYEALSAVADGRVKLLSPEEAEVVSSSMDKTYTVDLSPDGTEITSNDNASYWQGYIGYPIIAVLLETNRIPHDRQMSSLLAGVHWKKLNTQHKNNYDKAVAEVLENLENQGIQTAKLVAAVKDIHECLQRLDIKKLVGRRRSPPVS